MRKARVQAGLSQSALARALGLSNGAVSQWESHDKKPNRDHLAEIARITTVSIGFLMGEEELNGIEVSTRDPGEVALIRRYRALDPLARKSFHELVGKVLELSAVVSREDKHRSSPIE